MEPLIIQSIVEKVLEQMNFGNLNPYEIPIAVSARHVHLSKKDLAILFGEAYTLHKRKDLSQPNQFAAEETVTIAGTKEAIYNVRILGPLRNQSQVEISRTDAIKLGVRPPIRQSGNLTDTSPITLIGPKGSLYLHEGLIIAQAHIHMHPTDAERFDVQDGQFVRVNLRTERPITFEKVLIRVSPSYRLEMHIDTDEANAGMVQSGQFGTLNKDPNRDKDIENIIVNSQDPQKIEETTVHEGKVLSKMNVESSSNSTILIKKSTIVTELAKETARELRKNIKIIDT